MLHWWCCFCSAHFRSENQENSLGNKHLRAIGCDSRWFNLSHMAKHIWQFNIFVHLLSLSFSIHSFQKHLFKTFIQISIQPNLNHLIHYIPQQKTNGCRAPPKIAWKLPRKKTCVVSERRALPAQVDANAALSQVGRYLGTHRSTHRLHFLRAMRGLDTWIAVNGFGGTDGATRKTSREKTS